ncbi:acid phosphatase [Drechmeria coniospora]|uniref:Acid phosphatase n=1 Tax=Drechmeria coniospora TaxID=98403 RepID=A0A151GFI2_DRECN|nr:acid phosphatase [Drechmeria coniospora]KYK55844.1 acid phosphatase [Drechmeria coniospora]
MSTLEPRPPYAEAELAALYPPQLRLQQVQVFLRHGERTPIHARFTNTGLPPFWPYCSAVGQLRSAVLDPGKSLSTLQWKRRLETFGAHDAPVLAEGPNGDVDNICDMGMLTDRGRETTFQLGQRLRRLYVDQLGFLPAAFKSADFIYLRATPIPRALESMQQALQGMYPSHTRDRDLPPLTIVTRSPADETLFPNDGNCRRFAALSRAFAQRAADRWNDSDDMAFLSAKLGRWMPGDRPKVAVDARPRLSGILDTISATKAHGPQTKLPAEFYDPKVEHALGKIAVEEWFAGYKESREYRMLGIGALLGDVVSRMVGSAEQGIVDERLEGMGNLRRNAMTPRFSLNGCHDTTLAATLASLGAFETDAWPPFTSHIAFELFSSADGSTPGSPSRWPAFLGRVGMRSPGIGRKTTADLTNSEKQSLEGYYVRIRYNDSPVTVPGCRVQGNHLPGDESFCTLEAFKAVVDKFTPQNWRKQCRTGLGEPAFPTKPEPAGY